jgi:hypothetical protein
MIKLLKLLTECNDCIRNSVKSPLLLESKQFLSEGLQYHLDNKLPISQPIYRYGSESYFKLFKEVRQLFTEGKIELFGVDKEIITETDLGESFKHNNEILYLDHIYESEDADAEDIKMIADEPFSESKTKKKNPPLGKPKRGGSKKFYVYVRDPKTKKIKKISFGAQGMSAKINNSKRRAAFSKRHNCPQKTDKTKASYWSCRLPRYAKLLGLKSNYSGFW